MLRVSLAPGAARRPRRRAARCVLTAAALMAIAPASSVAGVIVGTPGPDRLVSTDPAGDLLFGGGGYDVLVGGPGNDQMYGVRSGNEINGGGGDNYIEGGAGDDKVTAGDGRNTVYGGSGHDTITLGNGDNYVDPGGAPDVVTLGNGNNVVNGGSGGMELTAGSGNNTVFVGGLDTIQLGGGVNTVYVASVWNIKRVDCGGNPESRLFVNTKNDASLNGARKAVANGKIVNCPQMLPFDGPPLIKTQMAGVWEANFNLIGTDGPDKLLGGHGGGSIDGKGGDNIIWADFNQDTGGAEAQARTTRITAGDGNNTVFAGRGTNFVTLGNGRNFVRGGAWNNTISVGTGYNSVRLQGKGRNTVTFRGGSGYIESFANARKPRITCLNGARVTVIFGNTRPKTNCPVVENARTSKGKILQVQGVERIADSEPLILPAPVPGQYAGVARPF